LPNLADDQTTPVKSSAHSGIRSPEMVKRCIQLTERADGCPSESQERKTVDDKAVAAQRLHHTLYPASRNRREGNLHEALDADTDVIVGNQLPQHRLQRRHHQHHQRQDRKHGEQRNTSSQLRTVGADITVR